MIPYTVRLGRPEVRPLVESAHEAMFFERESGDRVRCTLCPHDCRIPDGARGACGVRVSRHGLLYSLVRDRVVARHVEPVEKKPLFHFLPGSDAYSIGTVGCNLHCSFCQNWQISQWAKDALPRHFEWSTDDEPGVGCPEIDVLDERIPGEAVTPEQIVRAAQSAGAKTIAYTYTEPTIFFELAYETACLAREAGLRNCFVTNGFISEAPQREISEVLDAANVDLKFFRDDKYKRTSRARLAPILEAIERYHELGVWLEVTTLVIPELNDSNEELADIAAFIRSVDPDIPWHVSQFHPAWRLQDKPVTPLETLRRARRIGQEAGLRYVYEGNVPGAGGEKTACPSCGAIVIERHGTTMLANRLERGRCPECDTSIAGVWGQSSDG